MDIFLQQIINGLTLGSVYAIVALGYTMVYGIIQLINFAHGEVVMIGAMVACALASGNVVAMVGALAFMVSDSIIGETRFVGPRRHERIAIMTTYHLGQVLLVLSLVR